LRRAERESDLSIRAVSREAGVVPQSFYLQFSSLEELLYEVYVVAYDELRDVIVAAGAEEAEPKERLRAVCLAYCAFAESQPVRYRALTQVLGQKDHPQWAGRRLPGSPAFDALKDAVAGALKAGGSSVDPFVAASTLWASLHGTVLLRAARPAFPWPPLKEMLEVLIDRTTGPPPQQKRRRRQES
jgi:AcrR family transcriptional regulator